MAVANKKILSKSGTFTKTVNAQIRLSQVGELHNEVAMIRSLGVVEVLGNVTIGRCRLEDQLVKFVQRLLARLHNFPIASSVVLLLNIDLRQLENSRFSRLDLLLITAIIIIIIKKMMVVQSRELGIGQLNLEVLEIELSTPQKSTELLETFCQVVLTPQLLEDHTLVTLELAFKISDAANQLARVFDATDVVEKNLAPLAVEF